MSARELKDLCRQNLRQRVSAHYFTDMESARRMAKADSSIAFWNVLGILFQIFLTSGSLIKKKSVDAKC